MLAAGLGVLLVAAAIVVTRAGGWERPGAAGPRPGQDGQAGLRLLVANDPAAFVLDVDTGAIRPVTGLPTDGERSVQVEPVGEDAVVVTRRDCRGSDCDAGDSAAYLVRHGDTAATWLGAASDVESAGDDRGVWLLSRQDASRCALGQVGLDGRPWRPPRPAPCDAVLIDELPAGLLVYGADGPTAPCSPPTAPCAGSPRWWTAWPEGTWYRRRSPAGPGRAGRRACRPGRRLAARRAADRRPPGAVPRAGSTQRPPVRDLVSGAGAGPG
jgi:hypothetical protein